MILDVGRKFWENVINRLNGKQELTDADFKFCDQIESLAITRKDKFVLAYLDTMIENSEQRESYFKEDMLWAVNKFYGKK